MDAKAIHAQRQTEQIDAARRSAAIIRECADAVTAHAACAWREQRDMTATEWASVVTFACKARGAAESLALMATETAQGCETR